MKANTPCTYYMYVMKEYKGNHEFAAMFTVQVGYNLLDLFDHVTGALPPAGWYFDKIIAYTTEKTTKNKIDAYNELLKKYGWYQNPYAT